VQVEQPQGDRAALRERYLWAGIIFAVALVVRAIHIWQIDGSPFADLKLGDAEGYHLWAQKIVGGDWLGDEVFYQAPLYPYFLATIYWLLGQDVFIVRAVQILLGACSCVLIFLAGWQMLSRGAGKLAGILLALYAPAIFFDGLIQKSALDLFLLCLALWLASGLERKPTSYLRWCVLGLAMGALVLTRENALVLVAGILFWLTLRFRGLGRQRLVLAILFLAGVAALLLPVALRNQLVGGEFHLTTSQLGPNFFIGNNEGANGVYQPLLPRRGEYRFEQLDAIAVAEKAAGRSLTSREVSAYFARRSLDYIASHPGDWLKLMVRKFALAWNGMEMMDTEDQYTYASWSTLLRLTGYINHFGILAPLALLGVVLTWNQRGRIWLLHLLLALYTASLVMFYVTARYRYPMVPFLLLFAAAGVSQLPGFLRASARPRIIECATALSLIALFCNWPLVNKPGARSATHFNIGAALANQGEHEQAVAHYRKSIALLPTAAAHGALGALLVELGHAAEAEAQLRQALRLTPDFTAARLFLCNLLFGRGKLVEAAECYQQVLRIDPENVLAHYAIGNLRFGQRDLDQAAVHYRQALSIAPDHDEAHVKLGDLLLTQGRLQKAAGHYGEAARIKPENALAHYGLGVVHERRGDSEAAVAKFEHALRLKPDFTEARQRLQELQRGQVK
jgi:tetratricopeptide (TPR) repeat protein